MSQNATKKISTAWPRGLVAAFMSVMVSALSVAGAPTQTAQAAAPAAAPQWTQPVAGYTCLWYVVRRGDTLLELAARYHSDVLTLRRVNGLKTTRIYTGQRLCIPRYNAPNPNPNPNPSGPWYAEYWNNTTQSGPAIHLEDAPLFLAICEGEIFADSLALADLVPQAVLRSLADGFTFPLGDRE